MTREGPVVQMGTLGYDEKPWEGASAEIAKYILAKNLDLRDLTVCWALVAEGVDALSRAAIGRQEAVLAIRRVYSTNALSY